jgi:hypothetical protein
MPAFQLFVYEYIKKTLLRNSCSITIQDRTVHELYCLVSPDLPHSSLYQTDIFWLSIGNDFAESGPHICNEFKHYLCSVQFPGHPFSGC